MDSAKHYKDTEPLLLDLATWRTKELVQGARMVSINASQSPAAANALRATASMLANSLHAEGSCHVMRTPLAKTGTIARRVAERPFAGCDADVGARAV